MGQIVPLAESRGYLAEPNGAPKGGVIVIQEWWGLVPHIEDLAERFAEAGYVALAPDFYNGEATTEPDEAATLMMKLNLGKAAELIAAAAAQLTARPDVTAPVGVVGFCMGGALALLAGTVTPDIGVSVGFYPATPWSDYAPDWSKYAGKRAVVHASEEDGGTQTDGLKATAAGILDAGGSYAAYDYPGTRHAFFNDARPEVFDASAAALAWDRTLAAFAAIGS